MSYRLQYMLNLAGWLADYEGRDLNAGLTRFLSVYIRLLQFVFTKPAWSLHWRTVGLM